MGVSWRMTRVGRRGALRALLGAATLGLLAAGGARMAGQRASSAGGQQASSAQPACAATTFEGAGFTVCTFDARRDELRIAWQDAGGAALRGFAGLARALGDDARRVRFAMNAGMYDEEGRPVGLLVSEGATLHALEAGDGAGNFYLKPNGVFSVDRDHQVRVETSDAYAARHGEAAVTWATQSGPMLVIDGALHPAIAANGTSRKVRNGVGARDAHTALFVISDGEVSFGSIARLFLQELHCANALFLDGTVSSAWVPATGRRDAGHMLGPIAVVLGPR